MGRERSTEEDKPESPVESPKEEGKVEEAKGLSLRDALDVAVQATKEEKDDHRKSGENRAKNVPEKGQGSRNVDRESSKAQPKQEEETIPADKQDGGVPPLEPPAEYTSEEKSDFLSLSRKGQEAQLRLHRSRLKMLEDIKREKGEFDTYKKLASDVEPFIKAMGLKDAPPVAVQKAIKMWREFEDAKDPRVAAAAYLRAKGIEPPKEWGETSTAPDTKIIEEKITPLSSKLDAIANRLAEEDRQRTSAVLSQAWQSFEATKNAGGKPKFPDATNTESGLRLAANIGSLVRGDTELSKQFIANAKARIPDLTYPKLLEEAYRYYGGRVDDSEAPRTQDTQKHIARSSRAAASVPGSGAQSGGSGTTKKYKTYREALEAAHRELNEGS